MLISDAALYELVLLSSTAEWSLFMVQRQSHDLPYIRILVSQATLEQNRK
jgi:hypothetical protein